MSSPIKVVGGTKARLVQEIFTICCNRTLTILRHWKQKQTGKGGEKEEEEQDDKGERSAGFP